MIDFDNRPWGRWEEYVLRADISGKAHHRLPRKAAVVAITSSASGNLGRGTGERGKMSLVTKPLKFAPIR